MKNYQYEVTHDFGSASGSILAESEEQAKEQLTGMYQSTFKDEDGKSQTCKVTDIKLQEVQA